MTLKIVHDFDKGLIPLMEGRGLIRGDMLFGKRTIDLKKSLHDFEVATPSGSPLKIKAPEQRQYVHRFKSDPFHAFRVMGISSMNSDLTAKNIAVWMFGFAFKHFMTHRKEQRAGCSMPLWHRVYGGLGDRLLDSSDRPAMLVMSNITTLSTNYKLEKVRDLLEKYHDIPRIVVIGGADPVTFFRQRLFYPIDAALLVGGSGKHNIVEMDL